MYHTKLRGTGVAIITPFRKDGSIDFKALENLVEFQITNGVEYIVVLGTTGESVTLSTDEKSAIISAVKEKINKRIGLVVGCGGNNTQHVIDCIGQIDFKDIDALLSVAPYYNKPSQEGLFQHYQAVANASPVPVILYNVPGRTGSNVSAETTLRLANNKNIIAMKEASGNMAQIMQIIKNKPENFMLISGDDSLTFPIIALGGEGVISVAANIVPAQFSGMVRSLLQGDYESARKAHYGMVDLINALFEEGSPAGIKAALTAKGFIENNLRLPLVPASDGLKTKIANLLK